MAAFVPTTAPFPIIGVSRGPEENVLVASGSYTATAQQEFRVGGPTKIASVSIHTGSGSSGTESTVPTIEYFDVASGLWVIILTGAAIVSAGPLDTIMQVGPDALNVTNLSQNSALWRRMRINMTHANANAHIYSISIAAISES